MPAIQVYPVGGGHRRPTANFKRDRNIQHPTSKIQHRTNLERKSRATAQLAGEYSPNWLFAIGHLRSPVMATPSHPQATLRLTGSQPVGTLKPPRGYPEATLRLP